MFEKLSKKTGNQKLKPIILKGYDALCFYYSLYINPQPVKEPDGITLIQTKDGFKAIIDDLNLDFLQKD